VRSQRSVVTHGRSVKVNDSHQRPISLVVGRRS
jgi:hypothetical protein